MPSSTTNCLRCQIPLRRGVPDPKARAIVQSATVGYCANCMITRFLLSIEPIANTIKEKGPEILFGGSFLDTVRPVMAGVLSHTQLPEDQIDWVEVVSNWSMPWPKGRQPKLL